MSTQKGNRFFCTYFYSATLLSLSVLTVLLVESLGFSMKTIWRRQWQPTPILLPGKSHGRRSLVGCSPWGRKESDTTERLHFHFSRSCTGEANGNSLQCSCLKNPRDGRAWWATIYGVAQSRTRLKRLSNSSRSMQTIMSSVGCAGSPVVQNLRFHCRRCRSDPWLGN